MNAFEIPSSWTLFLPWIALAAVAAIGCVGFYRRREKESRLVREIRRRRQLTARLRTVVDNEEDASRLLRLEATRLHDNARSERVLVSAIARASRGAEHWQCLWEEVA